MSECATTHSFSMEGMNMGISVNNSLSFNLNSGVKMSGIAHSKQSDGKAAGIKHGSVNIKSNSSSVISDNLTGGVVRNKAATLDISKEGRDLSRKLRQDKIQDLKDKTAETQDSLGRVDEMKKKLVNGEELTDEDREFINDELKKVAAQNYVEKRFHVMTKDDYQNVMSALQEHMVQRIQLYSDMQRELEAQRDSDEAGRNAQKLAEAEEEQSQKKRLVEILKDTLTEDDEEETTDTEESEVKVDEDTDNDSGVIEFAEDEETVVKTAEEQQKFRAINLIDKNKESLENMFGYSSAESDEVREYDSLMDAELIRSYDILTNDDISEEDKLKEFDYSMNYMASLQFDKMIETALAKTDFDSWLISKIEFNNHDNIHEVFEDDNIINGMGGIDMVREFLTNANVF